MTKASALYKWFSGLPPYKEPAGPDVGEAFRAGWDAALDHPLYRFAQQAVAEGRVLTKLMPPDSDGSGHRYAGYYCEDYDGPTDGVAPPPAEVRA